MLATLSISLALSTPPIRVRHNPIVANAATIDDPAILDEIAEALKGLGYPR